MDLEKVYKTGEGIECNILQLVKIEPEWAANIIQKYEKELNDQKVREHIDGVLPDECTHTYKESNGMVYTFRNVCELCGKDMTK